MLKVIEPKKFCLPVWIFCLLFMFSGCADLQKSMDDFGIEETPPLPDPVNLAYPFTDIPIPKGFDRDHAKSFVYESGSGTIKVGRLFFSGWAIWKKSCRSTKAKWSTRDGSSLTRWNMTEQSSTTKRKAGYQR